MTTIAAWAPAETLDPGSASTANISGPSVAALSDGRIAMVIPSPEQLAIEILNADGSVQTQRVAVADAANALPGNGAVGALLTPLPGGRAILTFQAVQDSVSGGFPQNQLQGQLIGSDGSFIGPAFAIQQSGARSIAKVDQSVAVLTDGRFVVTWTDSDGLHGDTSSSAVYGQMFDANGAKSGGIFLVNTVTAGTQRTPASTALADGGWVTVWLDGSLGHQSQRFDSSGAKVGAQVTIDATVPSGGAGPHPLATSLPNGDYAVLWRGSSSELGQAFHPDGTAAGAAFQVPVANLDNAISVTALANGQIAVAWSDVFRDSNLHLQIFNEDGSAASTDLVVEHGSLNGVFTSVVSPSLSTLADGRLALTWADRTSFDGGANPANVIWEGTTKLQIFDTRDPGQTIHGTTGSDQLYGTSGADHITGGGGNDLIVGSGGNDVLDGGLGADILKGGAGDTTYVIDNAGDQILGETSGVDTVQTTLSSYTLAGNLENLTYTGGGDFTGHGNNAANVITGGAGNDTLYGSGGDDVLHGQGGNDTLDGGAGNDTLDGGAGINTASYLTAAGAVTVSLAVSGAQDTGGDGIDTLSSIQNLTGSKFDDVLTGDAGNNVLNGGVGDDLLDGGAGNDTLIGATGNDTATYASATSAVTVNLGNTKAQDTGGAGIDTLGGIENLIGSAYDDTLTGGAGGSHLQGADGNDTLSGGAGNDVLDGGDGVDTASYASAGAAVTVSLAVSGGQDTHGAGTDTLVSIENLTGSKFDDTLTGDGGNNVLNGGSGNDLLDGGAGDDSLIGGAGINTAAYASAASAVTVNLTKTTAQDTLGDGVDTLSAIQNLTGSSFDDHLTGSNGDNLINGGDGNDVIDGWFGQDTLTGGAGNDTFVYTNIKESTLAAPDLITDVSSGDLIDLHMIDADTGTTGRQHFHLGATAGHAGDLVVSYDAGHDRTVIDLYVDSDATADARIWLSGNHTGLTASDFLL